MKFAFIAAQQVAFSIKALCRTLGVTRSGFYAWRKRPAPPSRRADAQLAVKVSAAHRRNRGVYGSPRIHRELRAQGVRVGRKRIERLMRENGLKGCQKKRFCCTTDSSHSMPIAANLLDRKFNPSAPNVVWAGDVTYIATEEGWLYLAVIVDLFSRRIVGWGVSATNDRNLALEALRHALHLRRPRRGLLHHTDRGSPYASEEYSAELRANGLIASMSRTGDCYDNAVVESLFGSLKSELGRQVYPTRSLATVTIADYIENFYNPQRRHSHLGYVSPIEFELKAQAAPFAA